MVAQGLAFATYQALGEARLSIPGDVALTSFDDELASDPRPGLTTIGLPHEKTGQLAVELPLGAEPTAAELLAPMSAVPRSSRPAASS